MILTDSDGFRWIQMDSDGFRWIQMDSDEFRWILMDSMGFFGIIVECFEISVGRGGFEWSGFSFPRDSFGFLWILWQFLRSFAIP